jgi:hypothetical protein
MKAKHLRIGNLVFGKYEDNNEVERSVLCRVLALDETGEMLQYKIWVETFGSSNQEYFDGFEPIPLTEEWLLKFGFEKSNDLDSFYHLRLINDWTKLFYDPKHGVCELSVSNHGAMIRKLKSVHQLQNLYFALTGEELIIK